MPPKLPPQAAISDTERDEILRRHAEGESRNSIARNVGRSGATVTKVVRAAGLSFERAPEIAAATTAKVVDLASRRATLALDLQADAERLRKQLWEPHEYFDWGGKDHDFGRHTTSEPGPAEKRALMAATATAIDRSLKLQPPLDDTGAEAAKSMLGALADGIRGLIGTDPDPAEEDSGEG